jgi:molybdate/tungstate transport system ATP-binding protein
MIAVSGLVIRQGAFGFDDISFAIADGTYAVLMGASGSGKTTLLECICGLRQPRAGTVQVAGVDVSRLPPSQRGIGYVPQDGALFPAMSVGQQLSFALRVRGVARPERETKAGVIAAELGITHLLERLPVGLSGGERQRVALGRALASSPRVLLLDEPFAAIDEAKHEELCILLTRVQREHALTVLHITHSRAEANRLAGQHLVLEDGRVKAVSGQA